MNRKNEQKKCTPWILVSDVRLNSIFKPFIGVALLALLVVLHTTAWAQRYSEPIFTEVQVSTDIAYGDLEAHRLDVYQPEGDTESDRLAILLVHGGGFRAGDKQQDFFIEIATEFAKRGYVSFSINYRLANPRSNPSIPDTAVVDAGAALDWIKANHAEFGIDPDRISIGGDSAGGFIVVNLCYRNEAAAGAAACINLWGGGFADGGFEAPIYPHPIAPRTPPTLMIHGDADDIVPYQTSLDLVDQLEAADIYYELHRLEGADHYPVELSTEFIPVMVDFVYRQVFLAAPSTAVAEEIDTANLPTGYALEQNYPNPFNSGTLIRFALPRSTEVQLAIYNSVGQKVATVVEGSYQAGTYSAHWDGRDDDGYALASGAYLYRLQAGAQTEVRKLLLLR